MKRRRLGSWMLLILYSISTVLGVAMNPNAKEVATSASNVPEAQPMAYILEMTAFSEPVFASETYREEVKVEAIEEVYFQEETVTEVEVLTYNGPIVEANYSSSKELYNSYASKICRELYPEMNPFVIQAVIQRESSYDPNAYSSAADCVGLMQVSSKWHSDRAARLGVSDLYDPYGNILVGIDYLNELYLDCGSLECALMVYNMGNDGYDAYNSGATSKYVTSVLELAATLESQGG